eukprot:14305650-Alexandrium_andersonii.AAC.1
MGQSSIQSRQPLVHSPSEHCVGNKKDGQNELKDEKGEKDEVNEMIEANSDSIKQRKAGKSRVEAVVEAKTGESEAGSGEKDQRSIQLLQPLSYDYF